MPNRTYFPNIDLSQSHRQWGRDVYFVETMAHTGVFRPNAAIDIPLGNRPASITPPRKRSAPEGSGEKSRQTRARQQQHRRRR